MTAPTPTSTWSVNRRAAKAVVLNAQDADDARLLLDVLGLVDGPQGREVLPDDARAYDLDVRRTSPAPAAAVDRREPLSTDDADAPASAPARRRREAVCGTISGYQRHLRIKQPTCEACKAAMREYTRARARKAGAGSSRSAGGA